MSTPKEREKEKEKEKSKFKSWVSAPFAPRRGSRSHSEQEVHQQPRPSRPVDTSVQNHRNAEGSAAASSGGRTDSVSHAPSSAPTRPTAHNQGSTQPPHINQTPEPRQALECNGAPQQRQQPGSGIASRPNHPPNIGGIRAGVHAGREAKTSWGEAVLRLQNSHPDKYQVLLSASKEGPLKEEDFRNVLGVSSDGQNETIRLPIALERIWQALQPIQQISALAARADPHMIAPYAVASLFAVIRVLQSSHEEDGVESRAC
jgi:hypothetical protein